MDAKMQECFKPHSLMHSALGLGLGIFLATLIPSLQSIWLGLGIAVVAVVLDYMRKS